jgi:hypothetical protein
MIVLTRIEVVFVTEEQTGVSVARSAAFIVSR